MKHLSLICLLVLPLFTFAAKTPTPPTCDDELVIDGVLLARAAHTFPNKVWKTYRTERRRQLNSIEGRIIAQARILDEVPETHPAARLMQRILTHLAERSGLVPYLRNPDLIHIRFVQDDETFKLPETKIEYGVWVINQEMVDLLQNDAELAVIAADALLRHTLAHDLAAHQSDGAVKRLIKRMRNVDKPMEPDDEVREALPIVLQNADYTPWAIAVLKLNLLNNNTAYGDIIFPIPLAEELNRDVNQTIAQLRKLQIPEVRRQPKKVLLEHLRALLRGEK